MMKAYPLIVRPSLFGADEVFRWVLILWHVHMKLRLLQIRISAPSQQQNDKARTDNYPLYTTPFGLNVGPSLIVA